MQASPATNSDTSTPLRLRGACRYDNSNGSECSTSARTLMNEGERNESLTTEGHLRCMQRQCDPLIATRLVEMHHPSNSITGVRMHWWSKPVRHCRIHRNSSGVGGAKSIGRDRAIHRRGAEASIFRRSRSSLLRLGGLSLENWLTAENLVFVIVTLIAIIAWIVLVWWLLGGRQAPDQAPPTQ